MAAPRMHIETGSTPSKEPDGKPEIAAEPTPEATHEEVEATVAEVAEVTVPVEPAEQQQKKKVVATVVQESEPEPEPEAPQPKAAPEAKASEAAPADQKVGKGGKPSVRDWVRSTFPGHEGAFWGAVIALIVALLIFMIGFFRVLLIILLVVVGIAIGQIIDGDPKIIRAITRLFKRDREEW